MGNEAKFKVGDRVRFVKGNALADAAGTIIGNGDGYYAWSVRLDKRSLDFGHTCDGLTDDFLGRYAQDSDLEHLAAAPQQLRIEAGKYYKTRDGRKVGPATEFGDDEYPWFVGGWAYTDQGRWLVGVEVGLDLIAEWVDEPRKGNPAAEVDNLRDEYGPVRAAANDNDLGSTAGFTVPVFDDDDAPIRYKDGKFIVRAASIVPPVADATSGKDDDEPDTKLLVSISADTSALDAEIDRVLKRLRKLKRKARKLGISLEYSELRDAA